MATEQLARRRFLKGLGAVAVTVTVGEQIALSNSVHAAPPEGKTVEPKTSGPHAFSEIGTDADPKILAASQHWGVIWARIIAKAWADWDDTPTHKSFKTKLIANPSFIIKKELNYDVNPELDLTIDVSSTGTYDSQKLDPWDGLTKHKLTMYLPKPPLPDQHAVALADYTDTGRTYPFTSL